MILARTTARWVKVVNVWDRNADFNLNSLRLWYVSVLVDITRTRASLIAGEMPTKSYVCERETKK
jgi:hypothetical protein